jgi:hypothetical protein
LFEQKDICLEQIPIISSKKSPSLEEKYLSVRDKGFCLQHDQLLLKNKGHLLAQND